jgi:hypothetical protein
LTGSSHCREWWAVNRAPPLKRSGDDKRRPTMPGIGVSEKEESVRIAGAVVRLNATAFEALLTNEPVELVISSPRYLLRTSAAGRGIAPQGWQYLAVFRGVVFHATTKSRLSIPPSIKTIEAEDIWMSFRGAK